MTVISPGCPDINPATGLPLIEESYIDVGGNVYGTDSSHWEPTYDCGSGYDSQPSPGYEPW